MHKDVEYVLYSEKDIENIVNRLAKQIEKDYNGREFVVVGLLKGCFVFMTDLVRKINLDFPIDFMVFGIITDATLSLKIVKSLCIYATVLPYKADGITISASSLR